MNNQKLHSNTYGKDSFVFHRNSEDSTYVGEHFCQGKFVSQFSSKLMIDVYTWMTNLLDRHTEPTPNFGSIALSIKAIQKLSGAHLEPKTLATVLDTLWTLNEQERERYEADCNMHNQEHGYNQDEDLPF